MTFQKLVVPRLTRDPLKNGMNNQGIAGQARNDNSGMESIKKVFENKKIVVILREVQQI